MGPLHLFLLLLITGGTTGGTCLLQHCLFLTFLEQPAGVWGVGAAWRGNCNGGWSPGTLQCPALTLLFSSLARVLHTSSLRLTPTYRKGTGAAGIGHWRSCEGGTSYEVGGTC